MIYTSYFSSKKYNKEDGISIARYNKFWKGNSYQYLYPSPRLLAWWKSLTKEEQLKNENINQYCQAYYEETLMDLNPHTVAAELDGKVLLCYEKSEDFCHRHIVAEWLERYGYKVKEL